jgi:hypothetical protein
MAKTCLRERHQTFHLRFITHIGVKESGTATITLDGPNSVVAACLVNIRNNDRGALRRETSRNDTPAAAPARASDDRNSILLHLANITLQRIACTPNFSNQLRFHNEPQ